MGIPALVRSVTASASASPTAGSDVSSPFGVLIGSATSNGVTYGGEPRFDMKRRNRIAPVLSGFWCSSKPSSAAQAPLTSTVAPSELVSDGFAWQNAASVERNSSAGERRSLGRAPPPFVAVSLPPENPARPGRPRLDHLQPEPLAQRPLRLLVAD